MDVDPKNTSDISSQDTDKISRVTQEMLDTFAEPKEKIPEEDVPEENITVEEISVEEISDEETLLEDLETEEPKKFQEEKTIVEFSEDETEQPKKEKKQHKPFFVLKHCIGVILILLLLAAGFGVWNRWFRFDDSAKIISNWQISGTSSVVVVDEKKINLGPNAVLNYKIDSGAKLLYYTIGDMSGVSHYRFSWDMNQLALIENCGSDAISTMFNDLLWFWDYMTCKLSKIELSPAYTKNNKEEVDTQNTGLEDIISSGQSDSILLDRVATKKSQEV